MPDILRAATSTRPLPVEVAGLTFQVDDACATRWILACSSEFVPWSLFPGMLAPEDSARANEMILNGELTDQDCRRAGFEILKRAAGRDWWQALKLVNSCDDEMGAMMGKLTLSGVDPDRMPFGRWLTSVYFVLIDGGEAKDVMKLNSSLMAPPTNIPEAMESDGEDDFASMVELARTMPGMTG